MIDLTTWHAVLGVIFALSFASLLIVLWQLLAYFVVGIEESAASMVPGPLQGALIWGICRPRASFVFAYRFSYATQRRYDWQQRA